MSTHPICRIHRVELVGNYTLRVHFDDGLQRTINFEPVLAGELFGPLRDPAVFAQVRVDPEVHTVEWPNGADFDPATLYDWPQQVDQWVMRAREWEQAAAGMLT